MTSNATTFRRQAQAIRGHVVADETPMSVIINNLQRPVEDVQKIFQRSWTQNERVRCDARDIMLGEIIRRSVFDTAGGTGFLHIIVASENVVVDGTTVRR
jgi:hypothetical protein